MSFKPVTRLPTFSKLDDKMYLRVARYLTNLKAEITTRRDSAKFTLFLDATYNLTEDNVMGEVIKCGWAKKKTGGRYKGNKVWKYIRQSVK